MNTHARESHQTRQQLPLFGLLMAVALLLRLWGIGFGLPYAYHVDETAYVEAALNLGIGEIGRQPNPTGFSNILFIEYGAYFVSGWLTGHFSSLVDFGRAYYSDPSIFLLLARLTSAVLGALNVAAVYWLGRELGGRRVGWVAALILALAFLHVRDSHYGVPDVTMTFFVSLSVLFCILSIRQPQSARYQIAAAAAGGYAIATKWTAVFITIPLALAVLYTVFQNTNPFSKLKSGVLTSLVPFLGGFVVSGFQIFLKPSAYLNYALREAQAGDSGGFGLWQIDQVSGWLFYLKTLSYGLGVVLLALAILGCLNRLRVVLRTRDMASILFLAFPLTYYLVMGMTRHYFARYALPLVPFMALLAAEALVIFISWLKTRQVKPNWGIAAALISITLVHPLGCSIRHNMLLTRQDTRTLAKQWIESHIPAETRIAVEWPWYGPPLSTIEEPVPDSSNIYDVYTAGPSKYGLSDHPVAWYRQQGFDYLVASSFIYNIPLVRQEREVERRAFYASLEDHFELVQEFKPSADETEPPFIFDEIYGPAISLWQRERPGPTLKVYKIN